MLACGSVPSGFSVAGLITSSPRAAVAVKPLAVDEKLEIGVHEDLLARHPEVSGIGSGDRSPSH